MLTLDPVGLDHGIFTVMRDGNPICAVDLDAFPRLIHQHEFVEYDALCDVAEQIMWVKSLGGAP